MVPIDERKEVLQKLRVSNGGYYFFIVYLFFVPRDDRQRVGDDFGGVLLFHLHYVGPGDYLSLLFLAVHMEAQILRGQVHVCRLHQGRVVEAREVYAEVIISLNRLP